MGISNVNKCAEFNFDNCRTNIHKFYFTIIIIYCDAMFYDLGPRERILAECGSTRRTVRQWLIVNFIPYLIEF